MGESNSIDRTRFSAVRLRELIDTYGSADDNALWEWCSNHLEITLNRAFEVASFYIKCDQTCGKDQCYANGEGCILDSPERKERLGGYMSAPAYLFRSRPKTPT